MSDQVGDVLCVEQGVEEVGGEVDGGLGGGGSGGGFGDRHRCWLLLLLVILHQSGL